MLLLQGGLPQQDAEGTWRSAPRACLQVCAFELLHRKARLVRCVCLAVMLSRCNHSWSQRAAAVSRTSLLQLFLPAAQRISCLLPHTACSPSQQIMFAYHLAHKLLPAVKSIMRLHQEEARRDAMPSSNSAAPHGCLRRCPACDAAVDVS